ncbi:Rad52/Rad22 family DNA repair protein, partial [Providencia rettgeri]
MDLEKLDEPFSPNDIEWRVQQSGKTNKGDCWAMVLAYVTNRAIQKRLDEVCGKQGWKNEFTPAPDKGVMCGCSGQLKLATVLEFFRYWFSDSFGGNP